MRRAPFNISNDVASAELLGVEMIARERNRQIVTERWSTVHDDEHTDSSMVIVAALYAVHGTGCDVVRSTNNPQNPQEIEHAWPDTWAEKFDKRGTHPRLRQLAIAGALIAAEIDRLQRQAMRDAANEEQPLPCPFCGSAAKTEEKDGQFVVGCTNAEKCSVNPFRFASDRATAVKLWNRRNA